MDTTTRWLAALAALTLAHGRPQALRVTEDVEPRDTRWDRPDELARIAESIGTAITRVLENFTDHQLSLLERTLSLEVEDMQADMPSEDALDDGPQELPANLSETEESQPRDQIQRINREQLKAQRLATIKNQIMNTLWPGGMPPQFVVPLNGSLSHPRLRQHDLIRVLAQDMHRPLHGDLYTEKIQSFYPSCEIPRNTDAELWGSNQVMNLLFDLSYPPTTQANINIVTAKLRLFKLSQGNATAAVEICPPAEPVDAQLDSALPKQQQFPTFTEDKMIRVSIYYYTRSLKKHRVKRKLLDSQMLSVTGEMWTEWNIRGAVKAWRDISRNFGLAIEVEDEDGAILPTDKYFAPMNCSQEASTSRPIPGFLVARALSTNVTNATFGQALHLDSVLFPMIDLCTLEYPESERPDTVYYHKPTDNSDPEQSINVRDRLNGLNTTSAYTEPQETEKHKIRHQNHKHLEVPHRHLETVRRDDGDSIEEITWADDLDGHQLRKQIIVQKVIMKSQNDQNDNDR